MTAMYIVTVKLPRDRNHDPKNKQTGKCAISPMCTDVTGQHHSFLTRLSPDKVRAMLEGEEGMSLTRIEEVPERTWLQG